MNICEYVLSFHFRTRSNNKTPDLGLKKLFLKFPKNII